MRPRPRVRRPGLHRRRQPQRAPRSRQARPVRRRRLAPEPAQDVLHPARRRRTRASGRSRWPSTWCRSCPRIRCTRDPEQRERHRTGQRRALRQRGHPGHQLGLHPAALGRRSGPRHQVGRPGRQLRGGAVGAVVPDPLHRQARPGGPRVHPRPAAADQGDRCHGRRRGQAADRLRLPRADRELPGGRNPHGRADRERGPGRARPLLRRHDRHPGRDRRGGGGPLVRRGQSAAGRAAHGGGAGRRSGSDPTTGRRRSSPPGSRPGSTGRRWHGSTRPTATATSCAPARPRGVRRPDASGAASPARTTFHIPATSASLMCGSCTFISTICRSRPATACRSKWERKPFTSRDRPKPISRAFRPPPGICPAAIKTHARPTSTSGSPRRAFGQSITTDTLRTDHDVERVQVQVEDLCPRSHRAPEEGSRAPRSRAAAGEDRPASRPDAEPSTEPCRLPRPW